MERVIVEWAAPGEPSYRVIQGGRGGAVTVERQAHPALSAEKSMPPWSPVPPYLYRLAVSALASALDGGFVRVPGFRLIRLAGEKTE